MVNYMVRIRGQLSDATTQFHAMQNYLPLQARDWLCVTDD